LEALDRGVVAVAEGDGVYVGWRLLGYDDENVAFNVYRDGALVNSAPLADSTNYFDPDGGSGSEYSVTALVGGAEAAPSTPVSVWGQNYLEIPVTLPAGAYSPNDASVGDLDGDGDYEIIVKIYPDNAQDNANSGVTDNTYLDAYDSTGSRLWRIDLGRNIRSGAHYSPFLVYDFDGDGRAELMVKTAEGTVDGEGNNVLMPGDSGRRARSKRRS
jgi:rhamnogalacturonan endolyase